MENKACLKCKINNKKKISKSNKQFLFQFIIRSNYNKQILYLKK